jgi:hypothetical protein
MRGSEREGEKKKKNVLVVDGVAVARRAGDCAHFVGAVAPGESLRLPSLKKTSLNLTRSRIFHDIVAGELCPDGHGSMVVVSGIGHCIVVARVAARSGHDTFRRGLWPIRPTRRPTGRLKQRRGHRIAQIFQRRGALQVTCVRRRLRDLARHRPCAVRMVGVRDCEAILAGELCPVARDRGATLEFGARKLLVPVDGERHICAHVVGVVGVLAGVRVVACGLSYVNIRTPVHDWRRGGAPTEMRIGRRVTARRVRMLTCACSVLPFWIPHQVLPEP